MRRQGGGLGLAEYLGEVVVSSRDPHSGAARCLPTTADELAGCRGSGLEASSRAELDSVERGAGEDLHLTGQHGDLVGDSDVELLLPSVDR